MRGVQWFGGFLSKKMSAQAVFNAVFATLVLKHSLALSGAKPNTLFQTKPRTEA
jgi:hypothetical protein